MYVASCDRFVSFKAGGDRMDDTFFFYRAGYRIAGREERPEKKVSPKNCLTFVLSNLLFGVVSVIIVPACIHGK